MNSNHIKQIQNYLLSEGFTDKTLIDDLPDHLVTECEQLVENEKLSFNQTFGIAKEKLLPDTPYQLEKDLKLLTTQKHNIMIKKTAYFGGYLSAAGITIAFLFVLLSYQNNSKAENLIEISGYEELMFSLSNEKKQNTNEFYQEFYKSTAQLKIKSLEQLELGQTVLIVSIVLFALTYLPFRFDNGYPKSELEFN